MKKQKEVETEIYLEFFQATDDSIILLLLS